MATKEQIQASLFDFQTGELRQNALAFFSTLGYVGVAGQLTAPTWEGLAADFPQANERIRPEKALVSEWRSIHLLFQLTGSTLHKKIDIFANGKVDGSIIESYLFFAIELKSEEYSRTKLSDITREINRLFAMPVMVLFKYGERLSLSVIHRRIHRLDADKDVLLKVTSIKDIHFQQTHRAHLEILFDLSFDRLYQTWQFHNFVDLHKAWQRTLDSSELNKRFFSELSNWYFWAVEEVDFPADMEPDPKKRHPIAVIRLLTRLIFVWFLKEKGNLVPEDLFDPKKLPSILNGFFGQNGTGDSTGSTYYKAILQNLFFATLNTEMNKDKPGNRKFVHRQPGVQGYFRYQRFFKKPEEALALFQDIPFLNGGLFENLDKGTGTANRIDCFSDRRDNEERLKVPDYLFFPPDPNNPEKEVDLNEVYGTKNRRYKVRPLVDLLRRYKFTIAENTPIDEEVALDPELLGRVFENLLASFVPETKTTARKQTGSFYTPREIVDFMVDESLKAHLLTRLVDWHSEKLGKQAAGFIAPEKPEQLSIFGGQTPKQASLGFTAPLFDDSEKEKLSKQLDELFAYSDSKPNFSEEEKEELLKAIDQIRILDPACGSGAYPMGILHRLVFLLGRLDDKNERWRKLQVDRAMRETEDAYTKAVDEEERHVRLEDIQHVFDFNASDYGRKLYLIENCIFGVDIQPIAVQIAKLRFFISLLVDQRIRPNARNLGIRSLPNLETKFVAADTLIGFEKARQLEIFEDKKIEVLKHELGLVREKHFFARTTDTKEKYRKKDEEIRNGIKAILLVNIEANCLKLEKEISEYEGYFSQLREQEQKLNDELGKLGKEAPESTKIPKLKTDLAKVQASMKTNTSEINRRVAQLNERPSLERQADLLAKWSPYDQNAHADFFDRKWMFNMEGGFDVVIGNPPYVQIQKKEDTYKALLEKQEYVTYTRTGDLYCLFYEKGWQLLAPKGWLAYITSNKWMRADYGEVIRRFFVQKTNPVRVVDFGMTQNFESATTYTNIMIFQRATNDRRMAMCRVDNDYQPEKTSLLSYCKEHEIVTDDLDEGTWVVRDKTEYTIVERMEAQGVPLEKWEIQINRGIVTGFNEAFIIPGEKKEELIRQDPKSAEILKPLLRGEDVRAWVPQFAEQWLVFVPWHFPLHEDETVKGVSKAAEEKFKEAYPAVYQHLVGYRKELSNRNKAETNVRYEWYALQRWGAEYWKDFSKPKIIYPDITKYLPFVYDETGTYFTNDRCFFITGNNLTYLACLFNSKLFKFSIAGKFPELMGDTFKLVKTLFKKLPVKKISDEAQKPYELLADYMLLLKATERGGNSAAQAAFFEELINGMVYELYFTKEVTDEGCAVTDLASEILQPLPTNPDEQLAVVEAVYAQLNAPSSEVRNRLLRMVAAVEVVHTIETRLATKK